MQKSFSEYKIAIIGGGSLADLSILKGKRLKSISTPYGKVSYYLIKNSPLILRHGPKKNIPPHKINHKANISALKKLGVKFIFSFNSVGSLKLNLKPGIFFLPSDYIDFSGPITFYDKKCYHVTPKISFELREISEKILNKLKIKFKKDGVYFNMTGPRLETKAEIRMIKNFTDVVGMTMAKEATLASELNLKYVSLCTIDNFANGLGKTSLVQEEISRNQKEATKKIEKIIKEIIKLKI